MPRIRSFEPVGTGLALASILCLLASPAWAGELVCGDGVVGGDEECDDGNVASLDGCSASCRYEQIQRLTRLELQDGTAPGFCDPVTNQLGSAFTGAGLSAFNDVLEAATDESNLLLHFLGLDDPTGEDDGALELGVTSSIRDPADPSPFGTFDDWFVVHQAVLGADGEPLLGLSPASIASFALAAGPSDLVLELLGSELGLLDAHLQGAVSSASSVPEPPPDDFAAGFTAFESVDGSEAGAGLCGNVTVGTLATLPVPDLLATGPTACGDCASSRVYVACDGPVDDSCHSLLDVLVGGCVAVSCIVPAVVPTQPDVGVDDDPPATLVFEMTGGGIEKVTVVEPNDAYSSWFHLDSRRVHVTAVVLFGDGFESGDAGAWSSTVP